MTTDFESFVKRFLGGRINWRAVPRVGGIINFGNIISLCLYRQPPFQVELFIAPHHQSTFTPHKHPDVDVVEFGLTGDAELIINGTPSCSKEQVRQWSQGLQPTVPVHIAPTDMHSGTGYTPYAFLSLQHWLHGVEITSVGLNWDGEASSVEQEAMWHHEGK